MNTQPSTPPQTDSSFSILKNRLQRRVRIDIPRLVKYIKSHTRDILLLKSRRDLIINDGSISKTWETPEELDEMISVCLALVEDAWEDICSEAGIDFTPATLILFSGSINIEGREIEGLSGPFYEPKSRTIYLDPTFLEYFRDNFYPGTEDFTVAYIIAHEYAHHIQNGFHYPLPGEQDISNVLGLRNHAIENHIEHAGKAEQIIELHADYLTGVALARANAMEPFFHKDDIREGFETALFIGDDMLQYRRTGDVTPHSFTHGSGEQRSQAFKAGLLSGDAFHFDVPKLYDIFQNQAVNGDPHSSISMF